MKNNTTSIQKIQDDLNERLTAFAGRRYEGTEFHEWYFNEILDYLNKQGIKELRPTTWEIATDMSESGVSFFVEKVADVKIDFNRDKRCKYKTRGMILTMKVAFRPELLAMTCDEARRFLFNEKRDEMVTRARQIRDEALEKAANAAAEIERLEALEF